MTDPCVEIAQQVRVSLSDGRGLTSAGERLREGQKESIGRLGGPYLLRGQLPYEVVLLTDPLMCSGPNSMSLSAFTSRNFSFASSLLFKSEVEMT